MACSYPRLDCGSAAISFHFFLGVVMAYFCPLWNSDWFLNYFCWSTSLNPFLKIVLEWSLFLAIVLRHSQGHLLKHLALVGPLLRPQLLCQLHMKVEGWPFSRVRGVMLSLLISISCPYSSLNAFCTPNQNVIFSLAIISVPIFTIGFIHSMTHGLHLFNSLFLLVFSIGCLHL